MTDFPDTGLIGMKPSATDLTRDSEVDKRPMVRVYQFGPGTLTLQLRSLGPVNQRGGGAEKHIVSHLNMDVQQARRLIAVMTKWVKEQK